MTRDSDEFMRRAIASSRCYLTTIITVPDKGDEFWKCELTNEIGLGVVAAYGRNPARASAFALRDFADMLLAEFPAFQPASGKEIKRGRCRRSPTKSKKKRTKKKGTKP